MAALLETMDPEQKTKDERELVETVRKLKGNLEKVIDDQGPTVEFALTKNAFLIVNTAKYGTPSDLTELLTNCGLDSNIVSILGGMLLDKYSQGM